MTKYLLFLILGYVGFAQESRDSVANGLKFKGKVRLEYVFPFQFGGNSHAQSQKATGGLTFSWDMLSYREFRFGIGIQRLLFEVTDKTTMGALSNTNDTNLYAYFGYEFALNDQLTLRPEIGGGYSRVDRGVISYTNQQDGFNIKSGIRAELRRRKAVSFNAGLFFTYNRFQINTTPEYVDYFSQAQSLQISAGINIKLVDKKSKHKKR